MKITIKRTLLVWSASLLSIMPFFQSHVVAEEIAFGNRVDDGITRLWPDNLFAVAFSDEQHGIIAGDHGRVMKTDDGGHSWMLGNVGTSELVRRAAVISAQKVWAVGHRGSIFYSADGGLSWVSQRDPDGTYLRDISFFDDQIGWAVGHGATILHTIDGGKSWNKQSLLGYKGRDLPRLNGVVALSESSAVLVGEFGVIAHTENGGSQWLLSPNDNDVTWTAIDGNASELLVVGLDGHLVRLSVADNQQRLAIKNRLISEFEGEEAKRKRKALQRKKTFIPRDPDWVLGDVEYSVSPIITGTSAHLFDVDLAIDGTAVIVGQGLILSYGSDGVTRLVADENLPIDFMWFGGVSRIGKDNFVSVGIRGAVVAGEISQQAFASKLVVAGAIPPAIRVETSNWNKNND